MARRLLRKYPRTVFKGVGEVQKQPFDRLLVMDLEATCKLHEQIEPQELIELPCAVLSTKTWQVENTFHEYVKPRVHPTLTPFCIQLTGIVQSMLDDQPHFPVVFKKFCDWLEEHKYFTDGNATFVTCGDWDLKVLLAGQCKYEKVPLPKHFERWINLKSTFCDVFQYYPRGLNRMLTELDITHEGRPHSGIEDTKALVKIIQALQEKHNAKFTVNSVADMSSVYLKHKQFIR